MKLDSELFDRIAAEAEASPRRRMHYDFRTSPNDTSQRILNVMMPDTVVPVHRHNETSETVIVCRGAVREEFYDEQGNKIKEFVLRAGSSCAGIQVPTGMYHTCVCLECGSVIFEAKDRPYDSSTTEDLLHVDPSDAK